MSVITKEVFFFILVVLSPKWLMQSSELEQMYTPSNCTILKTYTISLTPKVPWYRLAENKLFKLLTQAAIDLLSATVY